MVNRAFDKVRQAGGAMPAVVIRMLDALSHVAEHTADAAQRTALQRQADMIMRRAEEADFEPNDLGDVRARYGELVALIEHVSVHEDDDASLRQGTAGAGDDAPAAGTSAQPGGTADTLAGPLPGAR
jgi:hypothetical protein